MRDRSEESEVLRALRVLDLTEDIAGPVATMLFAECGADVVKIEPRAGAIDRGSNGFRTWNRSKRSVALDVDDPHDRAGLEQLLGAADVVVHAYGPTQAHALGLDDATLRTRHPQLVVCSVLGWPANHVDADRPTNEALAMARLGICDEQRAMGREGPVYIRFELGGWCAAYLVAVGVMARLIVRQRTGRGGAVHTSLVQGALVPMGMHWSRAERPSPMLALGMSKESGGSQATLFECADGLWVHLMPPGCDHLPMMRALLDELGPDGVRAANEAYGGFATAGIANAGANAVCFRRHTSAEWLDALWANDIPAQLAAPFGAIYDDEQSRVNGYIISMDDPEFGSITVPGHPITIAPSMRVRGVAPRLDADREAVFAEWTPRRVDATHDNDAADALGAAPLAGLRVLDFGNFLAGPYAPQMLADLGADVIKVEQTTGDPMRFADWPFAGCQRGKRTIALNLKAPGARDVLDRLVAGADVVHHNLRMPAATRLGLDADTLAKVNPQLIFCHTSSYGPRGLRADWPGYDQLFQAQCGWEVLGAGDGNAPMWHRFGFMDHLCAMSSAYATLLAVFERNRSGRGGRVAASLLGAGALTAGETYVLPDGQRAPMVILDAQQLGRSDGERMFRARDGWVMVAARTDGERAALFACLGVTEISAAPDAIGALAAAEVCDLLARAGVPVEPVRMQQRYAFFDSADNRAAGLVAQYEHREWGSFEQPGALWHFDDYTLRLDRPPPVLGEHTVEILNELGLDETAARALLEAGVCTQWGDVR